MTLKADQIGLLKLPALTSKSDEHISVEYVIPTHFTNVTLFVLKKRRENKKNSLR